MHEILANLNLRERNTGSYARSALQTSGSAILDSFSPITGERIASVETTTRQAYDTVIQSAQESFLAWRNVPAPQRGQIIREIADVIRANKQPLGELISLEMGKISAEGLGEVQEVIDIADFAVGLSRQLYGLTMHSERRGHRMYEQWHPLGIVGVISAFNFPMAVWAWNAMIAAVCGDVIVWKPSEHTPLCAVALNSLCAKVVEKHGFPGIFNLVVTAGREAGEWIASDSRIPLVSATGSCRMGRSVGETVARRFGRSLLELGGNNAVTIMADADLELAVRSTVFGAAGTAGQRCTTTRRILIEKSIEQKFIERMLKAYAQIRIGDPRQPGVLMGPLISKDAVDNYVRAIELARQQGGEIVCGGKLVGGLKSNLYVEPTIIKARSNMPIVSEETFAPILYVIPVSSLDEAISINNSVPQGLSSALFTRNLQQAEKFLSCCGSDCGIANVNLGTSGAEIGGAFGGEKETGGGREAGSDAWKQYMRRQTNTINFSNDLPLAQGISFELA